VYDDGAWANPLIDQKVVFVVVTDVHVNSPSIVRVRACHERAVHNVMPSVYDASPPSFAEKTDEFRPKHGRMPRRSGAGMLVPRRDRTDCKHD
jgi:hypothetical protein